MVGWDYIPDVLNPMYLSKFIERFVLKLFTSEVNARPVPLVRIDTRHLEDIWYGLSTTAVAGSKCPRNDFDLHELL